MLPGAMTGQARSVALFMPRKRLEAICGGLGPCQTCQKGRLVIIQLDAGHAAHTVCWSNDNNQHLKLQVHEPMATSVTALTMTVTY